MVIKDKLVGTGTALVTPMNPDGSINFKDLERLIEYNIRNQIDFLVCLGTTGEASSLSQKEKQAVLDFTLFKTNDRVPVVFGAFGGNNTQALIDQFTTFNLEGVAAILSANPAYVKPSQEGIYQHYVQLSKKSPLPIILYNVPGRTSSQIAVDTTLRLAHECHNIIGIKDASGHIANGTRLIKHKPENFIVWSGDDPTAFALNALGADGLISVLSNAFPLEYVDMIRAIHKGKLSIAQNINEFLYDLHHWLYIEGNPVGIKQLLTDKRLISSPSLRLPLTEMSTRNARALRDEAKKLKEKY